MITAEFQPFDKIPRLKRTVVVTEKIDGTNAQIYIDGDGDMHIGSRNRWLTGAGKQEDNFGFWAWCQENKEQLLTLGHGRHYGEWWGRGIQRGYGKQDRSFSLFNVARWQEQAPPACCSVVPVLYRGAWDELALHSLMADLKIGSKAAPGFTNPEGVVIWHSQSRQLYKVTFDDAHKGNE